ncbi:MAG: Arc family DNA-binding protein [Treponema sp.]|nr:Arc family DNA-binding protein [Treponema sp.]
MFKIRRESAEYESKSLRLPVEMIEQVQRLADENNLSFNRVIIQCVEYALAHLDDSDDTDKQ